MPVVCKIQKVVLSAALLLAMAIATTGCPAEDSQPAFQPSGTYIDGNKATGQGVSIVIDKSDFAHEVGKTQCPQKIGVITIKNNNDEEVTYSLARGQELERATDVSKTTGTLKKGEEVKIDLTFNCSQTDNVVEQWLVNVYKTADKAPLADSAINIKGDVKK